MTNNWMGVHEKWWLKLWQLYGLCGDRNQWKKRGAAYFLTKPTSCSMEINGENHHMSMRRLSSHLVCTKIFGHCIDTEERVSIFTCILQYHVVKESDCTWSSITGHQEMRRNICEEKSVNCVRPYIRILFFLRSVTVGSAKIVKRVFANSPRHDDRCFLFA